VDFVIRTGRRVTAIEVKSGRTPQSLAGMAAFAADFHPQRQLLVGEGGIELGEFLSRPPGYWLER
jgi:hypothetical protein